MRISLDKQTAEPSDERTKAQSASAVLTDLDEHGSPHLPLVIIHGPSLARSAAVTVPRRDEAECHSRDVAECHTAEKYSNVSGRERLRPTAANQ